MNNNIYYTRNIEEEEPVNKEIVIETPEEPTEEAPVETPAVETNPEYGELITRIEKLISDKVYMKNGSQGTRVGTVQEFLNIYFDKNSGIDNDYGPGTLSSVKEFQSKEGLSDDGQTGPETYEAMIDWLNNN